MRANATYMNHSQSREMAECVETFDSYHERGGILCIKDFWEREQVNERYGIPYSTFYRYARVDDKSKRTRLYSQVGPSPCSRGSDEDASATSGDAATLGGGENDHCFVSRSQLYDYLKCDGVTMGKLIAATKNGPDDPMLVKFELWHLHDECKKIDYFLVYYGYGQSRIRWELLKFMDNLVERYTNSKPERNRDHPPLTLWDIPTIQAPPICPLKQYQPTFADLRMAESNMEHVMNGGDWDG